MLSLLEVRLAMLEKLRSSCLTESHAKLLLLQPMTETAAIKAGVSPAWAGFLIPYFTPTGKLDKFWRYRFWPESRPSKGFASIATPAKPLRYVQAAGSELHVYMPPLTSSPWKDLMADPVQPLIITEGELKAACACANGLTTLGLGGVFSWSSKKHAQPLLPILEEFVWKGRDVYICFDSDRAQKPLVQLAASRLAVALTARGALVRDVSLPAAVDGSKQGIDDFILAHGPAAFETLVMRAVPEEGSLNLYQLNEEVAFVWDGPGKGNVVRLADGELIKPKDFTGAYYADWAHADYHINAKGEKGAPFIVADAPRWLASKTRFTVHGRIYLPGQPQLTDGGAYNIWRDTGQPPIKGDTGPWDELIAHMFKNAPASDILWFKRWVAYPLIHPGTKMHSCVMIWSDLGGTGKNLLGEIIALMYGPSNTYEATSDELVGRFNHWAEGKQFVVGDEIKLEDKRQASNLMKNLITHHGRTIEKKGIDSYVVEDYANYYITSQELLAITQEQGARRTFIHHATETAIGGKRGEDIKAWAVAGGAGHVRYYLEHELDMGDFSSKEAPPDTESFIDAIAYSRSDVDTWAVAARADPDQYFLSRAGKFNANYGGTQPEHAYDVYTPVELLNMYTAANGAEDNSGNRRVSLRALGIALDRAGFKKARGNNSRLNNLRATWWLTRINKEMTSGEAARLYRQERGLVEEVAGRGKTKNLGRRVQ